MKAPHRSRTTRLLPFLLPALLLLAFGCTDDRSPGEIFTQTIGDLLKGLIDVGVAVALGN